MPTGYGKMSFGPELRVFEQRKNYLVFQDPRGVLLCDDRNTIHCNAIVRNRTSMASIRNRDAGNIPADFEVLEEHATTTVAGRKRTHC
jgi:hypothetical protein